VLLESFVAQSPPARRAILDAMLGPNQRANLLLDAIKSGALPLAEIDTTRRDRLRKHRDPEVRQKSLELLGSEISSDRLALIQRYEPTLAAGNDPARGKEIFRKNCSTCHKVGQLGIDVGPDISDSRTKTAQQILTDILAPNRAIDSNYMSYAVVTKEGAIHNGLLTTETGGSITLKAAEGKTVTLLREDIDELRSSGLSLMPEGFETAIPPQEMADLVSFIKNWRYLKD
jgi:putative heme-binding domain-containing protein